MNILGPCRARLLGIAVGVVAAFGILAGGASAVIIKPGTGQTFSYQPLRSAAGAFDLAYGNLDYNGGPVMPSNVNYLIFWRPSGAAAYPSEYTTGLAKYFTDLAHDSGKATNVDSVASQYGDSTGQKSNYRSRSGGSLTDTDPYPASKCPVVAPVTNCLVDAQLQTELGNFLNAHHLARDLTHEYFLLLPPHVETCFNANAGAGYGGCSAEESANPLFCAYHGNSSGSPIFIYANDPYVVGNAGCDDGNHPNGPSDGALEGGLSHEHNESITDPLPNSTWANVWGGGEEVGDQCGGISGASLGTAPDGADYNQVINGDFYWYQEEWSNENHRCLQRLSVGTLPVARFAATAGTGDAEAFNASSSSGSPSIAHYNWQFNDGPGLSNPVEKTVPTVSHTFPSKVPFVIGLTVFTTNGTSKGAGGLITPGVSGFTPGFTFSPGSPTSGSPVSFSAITAIAGRPVTGYVWNFGDGSGGSGATPTHTYAAAGTYHVKLSMLSTGGSAITTRAVTVS